MEPSSKRPRLQQQEPNPTDGLAVMLTDVEEQDGTLLLWGLAADHQTVLLHVTDHHPYFFIPCPHLVSPDSQQLQQEPQAQDLQRLRRALNARLPDELHLQSLQALQLSPIMFYRPSQPDGVPYIQAHLKPGASAKKAAAAVEKIAAGGITGFSWRQRGTQAYEADVKLIMRFLSDTSLSGGSWLWACPTPSTAPTHVPRGGSTSTPAAAAAAAGLSVGPSQDLDNSSSSQQAGTSGSGGSDVLFDVVPPGSSSRRSSCDIELVCSWRCIHSLTPDAAQLAQQDWQPPALSQLQPLPQSLQSAAAAAAAGDILPLKLVVLDVLLAPADGADRSCNPAVDPVVAIASHVTHTASSSSNQQGSGAAGARPADLSPAGDDVDGKPAAAAAAAPDAAAAGGSPGQTAGSTKVVFLLSSPAAGAALPPELRAEGVSVRLCATERKLLLSWKEWLLQQDPDGLVVFQVRDNLGVLAARFAALQVDGGSAFLSRAAGRFSKALATKSVVQYSVAWVKSQSRMASTSNQETFKAEGMSGRVVYDVLRQVLTGQSLATFSLVDCCQSLLDLTLEIMPAHVIASLHRELAAAAATSPAAAPSGQPQQPHPRRSTPASATATPQAAPAGSTAAHSLISSSGAPSGHSTAADVQESQVPAVRAALRLARYSLARCGAVLGLMHRLASVPESFEMARATGLTLDQVAYNAQMIRTLSLLLRSAHRQGYILGGRQDAIQLVESPYLMHPIEHKTAGLYTTPVATCDFASLYPSLYRAYNLCYTTLVHPDDVSAIGRDQLTISPTGAAFLKPGTRAGILPAILGALMSARAATRATLKGVQQQQKQLAAASGSQQPGGAAVETSHQLAARVAVLDGRQKALKLTANALYGFTGAQASPLQCAAIADSCLAMGAATCRAAVTAINKAVEQQQLGPKAAGAKVIYAQTDSVFVHFPAATPAEAVLLGQQAAQLVTQQLPAPIELKYERVMSPFLLLHVNRYAGRSFETVAAVEAGSGSLLVKGVRAVWRQSAPYIQHTLMGALQRILMQGDVPAAVSFVEGEITRLLTGHVGVWELAMTGGLWRVTGQQLERAAAAAAADEDEGPKPPGGGAAAAAAGGGGGDAEDVKGPHTNLAVRLSKRDPNKKWLLGERLSYVLLTGSKSQDEAAEDPLTAVKEGMTPNYQLYWQNKLQTPLKEMFSTCLSPEQLRSLLHGPHTQFRASDTATGEVLEPLSSAPHADTPSSSILFAGLGSPAQGSPGAAAAAAAAAGGGGGGKPAVPATPGSSGKKNGRTGGGGGAGGAVGSPPAGGLATPSPGKKVGGSRQQGRMKAFFATTARCLGCKAVLQGQGLFGAPSSSSSGSGSSRQQPQPPPPGVDPGLCPACRQEEGKLEAVYLHTVGEQAGAAASLGAAHSACRRCHSGGQMGAVVCENGECPILYVRYQAERQLRGADKRLLRLEW